MSADNGDEADDGSPGNREVAYRLFAAEFDDADFSYSESDEDRAPNYVITPTGARVNRVFAVGVLTEVQPAGEDILRARLADPTGTFVIYAGQYQPDAQTFLERAEPPAYVAVTGKARTFQPEDSDVVYTSIRPESLNEVDETTRDRWTVGVARQTLERGGTMASAMDSEARGDGLHTELLERGVPDGLAAGVPLAMEHYDTTPGYLAAVRELALSAAELVAGEREEVEPLSLAPDEGGDADLNALAATADLDDAQPVESGGESGAATETTDGTTSTTATSSDVDEPTTQTESTDPSEPVETDEEPTDSEPTSEEETADADATSTADTPESEPVADDVTAADSASDDEAKTQPPAEDVDATGTASTEASGSTTGEDTTDEDAPAEESAELGDFDGEFELDEDEREEIKSEFGTEFTSGTDVDEPGEAGIDTPEPEPAAPDAEPESADVEMGERADDSAESAGSAAEESAAPEPDAGDDGADVDLEDAVMDAMTALDDGDGADRAAVIDRVSDEHGVPADAAEDAIQDALMNGRCYEPGDGLLKPI